LGQDSAGIGFVAFCIGLMEQDGGKLTISGAASQVKQLLTMIHLDHAVGISPDLTSAQRALSGAAAPPQA
jgi:hypothetical protein